MNVNLHTARYTALMLFGLFWCVTSHAACDKLQLTPRSAYDTATVVVQAKVENIQYLDPPTQDKTEPRIIVTLSVVKQWKGILQASLTLHTTHNQDSCNGFAFEAGKEYLVYAVTNQRSDNYFGKLFASNEPRLGVKVFGGTKLITQATDDLTFLNSIKN